MKKYIVICIIFLVIIVISIIGSIIVTPNNKVKKIDDIMVIQSNLEKNYSCYGYSIDNPKIVVNPYKIAPLSALIMFETKDSVKVDVYLENKDGEKYKLYSEELETKEHYLDIYNLYANFDNKVILVVDGKEYDFIIKTNLEYILSTEIVDENVEDITFIDNGYDLIGINSEKEILYYFSGFNNNIIQLDNGHLLVASSRKNNDNSYVGFSEIDMLGKIYNDYIIENGFYNKLFVMENGNYLVLSDDIIEIDKQNGKVLKKFKIDNVLDVNNILFDNENEQIIIFNENNKCIYDYKKMNVINCEDSINDNMVYNFKLEYGNFYKKFKQNRFGKNMETIIDKKSVNLLSYKKIDDVYKNCNIDFIQEFDRIVVSKECDDDIYVILDKFLDKKVYKINDNKFYINNVNLSGKYIIYVMINNELYKSGYYFNIK